MSKKPLLALISAIFPLLIWAQQDTLLINYGNGVLNGKNISDYTNKWKVTYIDGQGTETPNKIWTDYGQIIELNGKRYFHRVQDLYDPQMNLQDTWINMVEHETLIPVSFSALKPNGGFTYYQFEGNRIKGKTNQITLGEVTEIDAQLSHQVYDWNLYGMLLIGLPLKAGVVAKIPFYAPQTNESSWIIASVEEEISMTLPDGKNVKTWKVLTDQRLIFWLSSSAPYVIKLELQLQNDSKLVWEMI